MEAAHASCERIRAALEIEQILPGKEALSRVTVSVGIASLADAEGSAAVMAAADTALYRAKDSGGTALHSRPDASGAGYERLAADRIFR